MTKINPFPQLSQLLASSLLPSQVIIIRVDNTLISNVKNKAGE